MMCDETTGGGGRRWTAVGEKHRVVEARSNGV
jgi:hypothetical protein